MIKQRRLVTSSNTPNNDFKTFVKSLHLFLGIPITDKMYFSTQKRTHPSYLICGNNDKNNMIVGVKNFQRTQNLTRLVKKK